MRHVVHRARALASSSHPLPSAVVTLLSAGLAVSADLPRGRVLLLTGTVLAGQLSIGWSNDHLDAERDRAARRPDKPVALGAVSPGAAGTAALVALGVALALSVGLGGPGFAVALVGTACGWLYNLGVKATVLSWVPYAVAFGSLPALVTLSASPPRLPPAWALVAAALLGVAAHLANVLPDLRADRDAGLRGLPHRLGERGTALCATFVLLAGSMVILVGPGGRPGPWSWACAAAVAAVTAVAATVARRDPSSRRFFLAAMLVAALDLVSFALRGSRL